MKDYEYNAADFDTDDDDDKTEQDDYLGIERDSEEVLDDDDYEEGEGEGEGTDDDDLRHPGAKDVMEEQSSEDETSFGGQQSTPASTQYDVFGGGKEGRIDYVRTNCNRNSMVMYNQ